MGCWGVTAFESDAGLDAVDFIRRNLPEDGKLQLEKIIDALQQDEWNAPPKVYEGQSHSSPMAVAEIIIKFLDRNFNDLDYNGHWAAGAKKFSTVTSFIVTLQSIQWLCNYVFDTLQFAKKNAEFGAEHRVKWGGWFKEKDWIHWQEHMTTLVSRLDTLLHTVDYFIELIEQEYREEKEEEKLTTPVLCMK